MSDELPGSDRTVAAGNLQSPLPVVTGDPVAGTSLWQDAWRRLRKNSMAVASGGVILLLGLACLVGPTVLFAAAGYDAQTQNLAYGQQPNRQADPAANQHPH